MRIRYDFQLSLTLFRETPFLGSVVAHLVELVSLNCWLVGIVSVGSNPDGAQFVLPASLFLYYTLYLEVLVSVK